MADEWERAYGLDPTNPEDRNGDFNSDGYTNLEKYLNSLVPAQIFAQRLWRNHRKQRARSLSALMNGSPPV